MNKILILSVLLTLSGCGKAQIVQDIENSQAAYIACVRENKEKPHLCEEQKIVYESFVNQQQMMMRALSTPKTCIAGVNGVTNCW